ncbi:MAG: ABC transporter permease [Chloroflexales bacterium]|nr:ABC transporter permease [Chloroflexales bacterium]
MATTSVRPPKSATGRSSSLPPTVFWRIREAIPVSLMWTLSIISILAPLGLWLLVTMLALTPPLFLPAPSDVFAALGRLWAEGLLQQDIVSSLFRLMSGFLLALLISIPLGILIGTFPSIQYLFDPAIALVRYMPASAFIPLLIIWLGIGEAPKIALIFLGAFFFNTLMVADAVKFVPSDWIAASYTLGARRWQALLTVICPAVLPSVIDSARVNLAAAWNLVIISELVAATTGLGFRILKAQRFLRTDEIFAGLIVIGVIGVIMDLSFRLLHRWACPWVEGARGE